MGSGVFFRAIGLLLATLLVLAQPAAAQPAPPELTDTVNDFANVIDAGSRQELDRISRRLLEASGDALVVATVDTIEPWGDIQTYATEMFENHGRGIGTKDRDNGLLVLLAVKDRRVRVEVGYELEGFITDGFAGETSRDVMTPYFREGAYGQGLVAGVTTFASRIAEARGVTIDGLPQAPRRRRVEGGVPLIVWIIIAFVILNAIRGGGGRGGRRGRWSSHVGPFGAGYWGWSAGRRGGGSWGGGGFGGGGFGGGFGGFGGGGSGGGGGGASW